MKKSYFGFNICHERTAGPFTNFYGNDSPSTKYQDPVVQRADNAMQRRYPYLVHKC